MINKRFFSKSYLLGLFALTYSLSSVSAIPNDANVLSVKDVLNHPVKITVSDAMGPVTGASVVVKGTTNGGVTDLDGNLELRDVPENSTLVISFVGYITQEISVGNQTTIEVTLVESSQALEEVVVVGYGVQRKSQVTGAISSVKSEDILNRAFTDATQALQGKTAGVQLILSSGAPGTTGNIRIRGVGSNSNNEPLYVVDGRQVNDISYLDSDDIQSMEILKDASAAAIYGARAGNGVILITTKQGENNTAGRVNYSFMTSWQTNNNVPTMLDAKQYYDYQIALNPSNQSALDRDWGNKTTNTDWLGEIFKTGRLTRHNLSFSGGTNDLKYYMAGSYNTNDGPVVGDKDKFERLTGTFNGEYQVKKWLKISSQNNLSISKMKGMAGMNNLFGYTMRYTPLVEPTVSEPTDFMKSYLESGYQLIQDKDGNYPIIPVYTMGDDTNPLNALYNFNTRNKMTNFSGTTSLILTPIKNLVVTSRLGYNIASNKSYTQTLPGVRNTQSMQYYQQVTATNTNNENYQWENFANYSFSLKDHNFTLMAGMSFIESSNMYTTGTVQGQGTDIGFPNTDPLYAYFAYKSGSYSQTVTGGEEIKARKLAYYGRFNWDYKDKYFVQASLRADAADLSQLPQSGRWGYFPAASIGWTVSNENFMQDVTAISHLKLRASWGQNGSTAGLANYAWQSAIATGSVYPFIADQMTYTTGKMPSTAGNQKLKWETSEQLDFGFDIRFWQNKLTFSYDWYKKTTKDLILTNITPSYVMGITASPFNAGKVVNTGHEFELSWRDRIGKDFNYSVTGNFTTLKNEVKEITSTLTYIEGTAQDSHTVTWFEQGYPMWHFKTYHFTGLDANGNPTFQDVNGNGQLDANDKVDAGSGIPTYSYGITLTAKYKNFDLTVFGSGQGGNKILQAVTRAFQLQSNVPAYLLEDAWTPNNTNTDVPQVGMDNVGYYYVSDAQIYKGDYFKLKQLQLGYTLPSKWVRKVSIGSIRVYGSIENLFTITNYPGFDPEIMNNGSNIGMDTGRYPNNRNFIIGANISF